MKTLYFDGKLTLREMERPRPGPGEALIQVMLAGICGTDRQILKGYSGFRGVPGHEFVGRVVESDQSNWIGKRVVGEINITCGNCVWCRRGLGRHCPHRGVLGIVNWDGAFADFLVLPVSNLRAVDANIPDYAAVFVEPLAAAAEILEQKTIAPDTRVAVLGAGRLGLLIAQVLRDARAEVTLISRSDWKLELARSWGIGLSNARGPELPARSFPVVVDATGSPQGLEEALRLVEPRGTVVMKSTFHGMAQFDTAKLVVDEVTLLGSRCGNFVTALELLSHQRVKVQEMVSRIFTLDEGLEAFEYLDRTSCLKVLLEPGGGKTS